MSEIFPEVVKKTLSSISDSHSDMPRKLYGTILRTLLMYCVYPGRVLSCFISVILKSPSGLGHLSVHSSRLFFWSSLLIWKRNLEGSASQHAWIVGLPSVLVTILSMDGQTISFVEQ